MILLIQTGSTEKIGLRRLINLVFTFWAWDAFRIPREWFSRKLKISNCSSEMRSRKENIPISVGSSYHRKNGWVKEEVTLLRTHKCSWESAVIPDAGNSILLWVIFSVHMLGEAPGVLEPSLLLMLLNPTNNFGVCSCLILMLPEPKAEKCKVSPFFLPSNFILISLNDGTWWKNVSKRI